MAWTEQVVDTPRLRLRAWRDADKPTIVSLLTDPNVRRHLGGPVPDEHAAAVRDATVGERWGSFCIARQGDDAAIGSVSLDRERGELEISYDLLPSSWGSGFATEAVAAMLAWVWQHTDDASVIAVTQTANERSLRLLRRLGFEPDREFEQYGEPQSQLRLARPAPDPI